MCLFACIAGCCKGRGLGDEISDSAFDDDDDIDDGPPVRAKSETVIPNPPPGIPIPMVTQPTATKTPSVGEIGVVDGQ